MRTATQVLLTLPATVSAPIGWLVIFSFHSASYDAPAPIYFAKAALFFFGSLVGLIALWRSIFATRAGSLMRPSGLLVAGLVVGLLLDAFFVFAGFISPPSNPDAPQVLFTVWLIGGPFIVGIWNLTAILPSQKRAEPTASPNAGPAERVGNSGVGGGPPSVS